MIVLDASAGVGLLMRLDPLGDAVRALIAAPGETVHVPELFDLEVMSALRRLSSRRETRSAVERALHNLRDFRARRYRHQPLLTRTWDLRDNVTPYDAAYVALAEILGAALVTADAGQARAARSRAGVETVLLNAR